jgi:predicted ATPase/class 3 adenylate cyclase
MTNLPSGTVTFLFTDIEGSTTLWEQDHAAMAVAVGRSIAILRAPIEGFGGSHFKTIGDATQSAFASAPEALAVALIAQRALLAEPWSEPIRSLAVRMALHAGEAEPDAHGDYLAAPLNRLARLLAICHGGQILVSQTVQQLTRGQLPAGASLQDLGEHRLRDLLEPERVFQLLHPDLPRTFPSLRSLDTLRHNLPIQFTALVGREDEIRRIGALLEHEGARLVTLTGAAGTGKTRLALAIAADVLDAYPDGAWFVDLAPLTDPALVLPTIATTLGVRESTTQPLQDALSAFLADKRLLLVLDNFEHLLPAASAVSDVLRAGSGVVALNTSREPLRLRGEREVAVLPLPVPSADARLDRDALTQVPAVALFVQRAQAAKTDFVLTEENAEAVAAICRRLDGLPLALELAAARVKLLPPQALLARLDRRLPVLTEGARDAPVRQRTLRAAIAWSHDLLDTPGQTLFRRLSVFAAGATLEAAETVANPDHDLDVFAGLSALVDKSLIRQIAGVGEPRFSMLETIREFAAEQLAASDEAASIRDRHGDVFLALAEEAEPQLEGPTQAMWLNRLEADYANLLTALRSLRETNPEHAFRLAGALWRFWWIRDMFIEGRTQLEELLRLPDETSGAARAKMFDGAGVLAECQGDYDQAIVHYQEAVDLWEAAGDQRRAARSLLNLGNAAAFRGDGGQATAYYEKGLAQLRALGDRRGVAVALTGLGLAAFLSGECDESVARYEESLVLWRELGDKQGIALTLDNLGEAELHRSRLQRAEERVAEALTILHELGARRGIASATINLGLVARAGGDRMLAARLLVDGLKIVREVDDRDAAARCLEALAGLAASEGRFEDGARLLGAAAGLREAIGMPIPSVYRAARDADAEVVRHALGAERFAELLVAGKDLGWERIAEDITSAAEESMEHESTSAVESC